MTRLCVGSGSSSLDDATAAGAEAARAALAGLAGAPPGLVIVYASIRYDLTELLAVVADGIETPAQQEALLAMGCRQGQGYLFSRPVAPDEASALLRSGALMTA